MKLTGVNITGARRGLSSKNSSMRFSEMSEARAKAASLQKERRPSKRDLSDLKMKRLEQHFHKPKIGRTSQAMI